MAIKSSVFSGPTNVMALGHPYVSPAYRKTPGPPMFIDVLSKELVKLDMWRRKDEGIINALYGLILGEIGIGKSSFLKVFAWRSMLLSAGFETMRISINDYKPEGKLSEYAAFSKKCRSIVFKMGEMSINPFEYRMFLDADGNVYELGILNMAIVLCEFGKRDFLDEDESTALRIAFSAMLESDQVFWTPHVLEKKLRSITTKEIDEYYENLDKKLEEQMQRRKKLIESPEMQAVVEGNIRQIVNARDNRNIITLRSAGERVAKILGGVLYGPYRSMFGDSHSIYDMVRQRATSRDWRGMTPDAEALMRIIDTTFRTASIENNRSDLIPHIELDDEKHKSMSNLIYARTNAYHSEISRGTHLMSLSATHRLGSIRKGNAGSEQHNLGDVIINNQGWVAIGRQQNSPQILGELSDRYRLTYANTRMLPKLPPRTFFLVEGDVEPPRLVRTFATKSEMEFLRTNEATDRMLRRPNVLSPEDQRRFAETNGIRYRGAVMEGVE